MKKIFERVVKSEGAPLETDIWLDTSTGALKYFDNGEWKTIAGGGNSNSSSSGSGTSNAMFVSGTVDNNQNFTQKE